MAPKTAHWKPSVSIISNLELFAGYWQFLCSWRAMTEIVLRWDITLLSLAPLPKKLSSITHNKEYRLFFHRKKQLFSLFYFSPFFTGAMSRRRQRFPHVKNPKAVRQALGFLLSIFLIPKEGEKTKRPVCRRKGKQWQEKQWYTAPWQPRRRQCSCPAP